MKKLILTHLSLMQIRDELGTRAVAGVYGSKPELRGSSKLSQGDQSRIKLDSLVVWTVVVRGHQDPVEVSRRHCAR